MTRDNILSYLNSLRKPEESDPDHKWIGTYKLRRVSIQTFFKWLYSPNLAQKDRGLLLKLWLTSMTYREKKSQL